MISIDFEEFFAWLASHSTDESVGQPGRCFHSPLARFLSCKYGCVIGEDGVKCGRSVMDECRWLALPLWAQRFSRLSEQFFGQSLSAYEAVGLLAQVETPFVALVAG